MSSTPPPADETPAGTPPARRWLRRRPADPAPDAAPPAAAAPPPPEQPTEVVVEQPTEVVPAPPRTEGQRELRRTRKRLVTEREDTVYHLGGLAFELYRRDQLSDEVMRLRAGQVAELDDTIRDIDSRLDAHDRDRRERRVRAPVDAAAGCCLTCRASFRAEARFCWQCGARLIPEGGGDEQPTVAIPVPPPT